ncbi:MAG: VWA domain-containing protein [Planctomycetota bacterium]
MSKSPDAGRRSRARERGIAVSWLAVGLAVLAGIAALAIDLGHLFATRGQLQTVADASALAGASGLAFGPDTARDRALSVAADNGADDLRADDVELGSWNASSHTFTAVSGADESTADAVRVTARRQQDRGTAVDMIFAPALADGPSSADVAASAVAWFGTEEQTWDVIIVQDVTASFKEEIGQARDALELFLGCLHDHADPLSNVGLVTFTGWGWILANLTQMQSGFGLLQTKIASLNYCGMLGMPPCSGTDIAAGLEKAVGMFGSSTSNPELGRAIVLVSDGEPNADKKGSHPKLNDAQLAALATQWADRASALGISIFAVFYNQDNDAHASAFLESLVRGRGIYLETPDPDVLPSLMWQVCATLPLRLVK